MTGLAPLGLAPLGLGGTDPDDGLFHPTSLSAAMTLGAPPLDLGDLVGLVAITATITLGTITLGDAPNELLTLDGLDASIEMPAISLRVVPTPVPPPTTAAYVAIKRVSPTMPAPTLDSRGRPT